MNVSSLKILIDDREYLDYAKPDDLQLKFNRIVDDLNDLSKRFGEFTFTISFPKTLNNSRVFEFPDVKGRTKIFVGKQFDCKVIVNSKVLLHGILELNGFDNEYKCSIYSKFGQLIDDLGNKKLSDLTSLPSITWDYEKTIVNHIRQNYTSSDDTTHQFPFCFYKTPFMSGCTSDISGVNPETFLAFKYNYFSSTGVTTFSTKNPIYYPQLPPAIYLKKIVEAVLADAGWNLGGSFFNDSNVKKMVLLFSGKNEQYSRAIISGATGTTLNLNKTLPDTSQINFLKSVVNLFNLYFTINTESKTIFFETFNVLFGDVLNPYDITEKLNLETIQVNKNRTTTKITFQSDDDNSLTAGYDRSINETNFTKPFSQYLSANSLWKQIAWNVTGTTSNYYQNSFSDFYNKTTGTDKEIQLVFSPTNLFTYNIYNTISISGTSWTNHKQPDAHHMVSIPLITTQTPTDNKNNFFCDDKTTPIVIGNDLSNMDYDGGLKLAYYYGTVQYDEQITGTTSTKFKDWTWLYVATGTSGTTVLHWHQIFQGFWVPTGYVVTKPTFTKVPIPIASPFKLISVQDKNNLLALWNQVDRSSVLSAEIQYLLMTYFVAGKSSGTYPTTDFSLTFGDNDGYQFDNLYSKFHKNKYYQLNNSATTTATMKMNEVDWDEMQINRTLKYNGELYKLISIKNYDPINQTAEINMLKKI